MAAPPPSGGMGLAQPSSVRSALSIPTPRLRRPARPGRSTLARMRRYRFVDALHLPSALSASRVPLGVVFIAVVDEPRFALLVLAMAAATDVLDGWVARRLRLSNATGALIDGVADKVFVACVAYALVSSGRVSWLGLLALATRELGELGMLAWYLLSHAQRRRGAPLPAADALGKTTTALQFLAVAAALLAPRALPPLLALAAVSGAIAGAHYIRRERARLVLRETPAPPSG
jgi:CDP-diacylglycerol--glycerol-3-phosphate 3-phosphatidyltransferase/cardiolipin synthase